MFVCPGSSANLVHRHVADHPQELPLVTEWAPHCHFLQGSLSQAQMSLIMAVNTTIWHTRCLIANGNNFTDRDDMLRYAVRAATDPLYNKRIRRRRAPVKPGPVASDAVLYRSDGAARGQGNGSEVKNGAGAVAYEGDGNVDAWVSVGLGNVSNNMAEYEGGFPCFAADRASLSS